MILWLQMEVTQQDLQVMMAVLRENRTEETMHVDKVGMYREVMKERLSVRHQ